jgi:hypothetical protein
VYHGAPSFDFAAPVEIGPPMGTTPAEFGNELEGAFDLNSDGYPDLAIMDGDDGRIHVVTGGGSGSRAISASLVTGGACNYYAGAKLTRAGDMTGDGISELAARCGSRILVYRGARTPELQPLWQFDVGADGVTYAPDLAGGYDLGQDGLADLVFHARSSSVRNLMVLGGNTALSAESTAVVFGGRLADSGDAVTGDGVTIGDHDGDGRSDVVVQIASAPYNLRWFAGGRIEASSETCAQPSSSFEAIGNWCEAATENVEGKYQTSMVAEYAVGNSFGHVLAR